MHTLIKQLAEKGWRVNLTNTAFILPREIRERYKALPVEVSDILSGISACISPDEKSWLLCMPDYHSESEAAFSWNEFEKESLQAAEGDDDWLNEIKAFWDTHFPVFISIRSGYEYSAISLDKESFGMIVSGREPEYEETTVIASSYSEFISTLL